MSRKVLMVMAGRVPIKAAKSPREVFAKYVTALVISPPTRKYRTYLNSTIASR